MREELLCVKHMENKSGYRECIRIGGLNADKSSDAKQFSITSSTEF